MYGFWGWEVKVHKEEWKWYKNEIAVTMSNLNAIIFFTAIINKN